MNDFCVTWQFTRRRLDEAIGALSDRQMNWRPFEGAHTVFEYLYHVAGAEHYWATRLARRDPAASEFEERLDRAVVDGFLREGICPFDGPDLSAERVRAALDFTYEELLSVITNPSEDVLEMRLTSPIGDVVSGREGLARLCQHAGYHTGQINLLKMMPGFPKS